MIEQQLVDKWIRELSEMGYTSDQMRKVFRLAGEKFQIIKRKQDIDKLQYEDMLQLMRFASIGHQYFSGELGDYFTYRMKYLKTLYTDSGLVLISKSVGWKKV